MKFELDTKTKTVKLLDDATLGEVNEVLEKVLGDEAKGYRLITNVTNYAPVFVGHPYIVEPYVRWWEGSTIDCGGTGTNGYLTLTNASN